MSGTPNRANCGKWPRDPTMKCMARNAFNAATRIITASVTGERVRVSPEVAESRLAVCRGCNYFDSDRVRCKLCGCRMSGVLGKVQWATEACPANPPKW